MIKRPVLQLVFLLVLSGSGCGKGGYSSDNIDELLRNGLIREGQYNVISNYYIGGWDFYEGVGLLQTFDAHDYCNEEAIRTIRVKIEKIDASFRENSTPQYRKEGGGRVDEINNKKFMVCEKVIRSGNGNWLAVLVLDKKYLYFETRYTPYNPSDGFRYIELTK